MSQSDFDVIYGQTVKLAETLSEKGFDEDFLSTYKTYSAFITQLIQILKSMDNKTDDIRLKTKNLLAMHKKVEYRLIYMKDEIRNNITNKIRKEHIRQKYSAKNLRTAILNKKA